MLEHPCIIIYYYLYLVKGATKAQVSYHSEVTQWMNKERGDPNPGLFISIILIPCPAMLSHIQLGCGSQPFFPDRFNINSRLYCL